MRKLLIILFFLLSFQYAFGIVITNQTTPIYSDPNNQSQEVTTLQSGDQVALLKTNLQNGYSLVQTATGQQGWLLTTSLNQQPQVNKPKPGFLARIWSDITHKQSSTTIATTNAAIATPTTVAPTPATNTQSVSKQTVKQSSVKSSAKSAVVESTVPNQLLSNQVMQLQQQVTALQAEQHQQWYWFIWGALIAFIGLVVGMFLGRRRQKQRSRSLFH